ncbi:MAG TPA: hypothetical protein VM386_06550, partial [Acidimicrobiales bacterium]|nr:hypothetical protein [Acidimicrobiales bacterium]
MVLVILAMVWAVFLLPQLFRARAERSTDSISAFRRQLSVLERTAPVGRGSVTRLGPAPTGRPLAGARPIGSVGAGLRTAPATIGVPAASRHRAAGRANARKRRRDIFCGLLVAIGVSLVLSLVPAMRMMLWVHLALDVVFVAYVALLVRARNLA